MWIKPTKILLLAVVSLFLILKSYSELLQRYFLTIFVTYINTLLMKDKKKMFSFFFLNKLFSNYIL